MWFATTLGRSSSRCGSSTPSPPKVVSLLLHIGSGGVRTSWQSFHPSASDLRRGVVLRQKHIHSEPPGFSDNSPSLMLAAILCLFRFVRLLGSGHESRTIQVVTPRRGAIGPVLRLTAIRTARNETAQTQSNHL
jgi:hypothetical protein